MTTSEAAGLRAIQRRAFANKIAKGFNVTDVPMEFGLLVEEIGEAFSAWRKQKPVGPELADVAIFLCGLAEILGVDLDAEVAAKMDRNERREYVTLPNGTPVKAAVSSEQAGTCMGWWRGDDGELHACGSDRGHSPECRCVCGRHYSETVDER